MNSAYFERLIDYADYTVQFDGYAKDYVQFTVRINRDEFDYKKLYTEEEKNHAKSLGKPNVSTRTKRKNG